MKFRCRWCGLVFIGRGAVHRWSSHTWVHIDEVPELAGLAKVLS